MADRILRWRKNNELMLSGVTIENPESVLVDVNVTVGMDTLIGANAQSASKLGGGQLPYRARSDAEELRDR